MAYETVEFSCAVRGYHVYKSFWAPKERQELTCYHEIDNRYDLFAIKTCLTDENYYEEVVGHLPLEISRVTKYLLDRGAAITATLTSTRYRRSPLIQGGLEIPCVVKAEMIGTQKNKLLLARYLDVASENYNDVPPEQEVIIGTFANNEKQDEDPEDLTSVVASGSRNKERKIKPVIKRANKKDIRSFFAKNTANDNQSTQPIVVAADTATDFHINEPIVVIID